MPVTSLLFTVGDVPFFDLEAPERLGPFGGVQRMAQHEFPGGIITQQKYGAFPSPLVWTGIFLGTDALLRATTLDRLRVAGEEVALTYGPYVLLGTITEFEATVRYQWYVDYRMRFAPREDPSSGTPLDGFISAVALINSALGVLNTIVSVIAGLFASGGHQLTNIQAGQVYMPLPPTLAPPLLNFITLTEDALATALGLPQNISFGDAAAIQAAAAALLAVAQPLTVSGDPTVSSPALDMIGYINTVMGVVGSPTLQSTTTLEVVNPNLLRIAAQYFGDSSRWQDIATASGINPPDPTPIGAFTLTIPARPS
jgi:hypothetical protein